MKKLTRLLIALFLVLLCTIILFKCNNPVRTWYHNEMQKKAVYTEIKTIEKLQYQYIHDTVTLKVVDVRYRTHASAKVLVATQSEMKVLKIKLDSVSKLYGIKSKQLDNQFSANVGFSGNETSIASDEFGDNAEKVFIFNRGFLNAKFIVDSPEVQHVTFYYSGNIALHGALYWERPIHILGLGFGKKIWTQQLYCDDTSLKVNSIRSMKIIKK